MSGRRPVDNITRENFVYTMSDVEGRALYIGVTRNPDARRRTHEQVNPGLIAAAATCKMRGPYTRPVAMRIERAQIVLKDPLFNLEVNKRHKLPIIQELNEAAQIVAQRAVLDRYGIKAPAAEKATRPTRQQLIEHTGTAAEIRAMLAVKRVSIKALAERTGISRNALSDQINGKKAPAAETVEAIAKALDVPLAALTTDEYVA